MKIAALVSGGVDSSVALSLLEENDIDVTAFYLRIWLDKDTHHLGDCPWEEDLSYIRELCKLTNVKLEVIDLQKEYYQRVVEHALEEIKLGRTPNPDIWCNSRIKFGFFSEIVTNQGYDKIASGHYAQISQINGEICLKQAPDPIKDQTYFLSHLSQDKLSQLVFPIGKYQKSEVRSLASEMALPNASRKDSQGICFLGKFKYRDFLNHYLGTKKGNFIEYETGRRVGEHSGHWYYTSGQRRGLGIGGPGSPWYVVGKNPVENLVLVSQQYFGNHFNRREFSISDCNWFSSQVGSMSGLKVKLRHGPKKTPCRINFLDNQVLVTLEEDDQGIAPGQYAVFYLNDLCVGSGVICEPNQ